MFDFVPPAIATLVAAPALPSWRHRLALWLATLDGRRRLIRCAALDPRFPADIGLTPIDIVVESRRPFWQPLRRD
jgi:uncharacterized protein YjiS (DUF1127 family)